MTDRAHRLRSLLDALKTMSKDGGAATAQELAEVVGISVRTLYRDVDRLRAAGVGVDGKTGVGLRLDGNTKLPSDLNGSNRSGLFEAKIEATSSGLRLLAHDPLINLLAGSGQQRTVRAKSRDPIIRAVLNAGGEIVVVSPKKLRREVRLRARAVARSHRD